MNLEKLKTILENLKNKASEPMSQPRDLEIKILEAMLE